MKSPIALVMSVFFPVMVHVTREPEPSGWMAKTVSLRPFHGFSNTRSICTRVGSVAAEISMRP